jgi:hypothetical protein
VTRGEDAVCALAQIMRVVCALSKGVPVGQARGIIGPGISALASDLHHAIDTRWPPDPYISSPQLQAVSFAYSLSPTTT